MKYIENYKVFETIQQARKILSKELSEDDTKRYIWDRLEKAAIENKFQNYLGWIAKHYYFIDNVINWDDYSDDKNNELLDEAIDTHIEKIEEFIQKVKKYKINIDGRDYYDINREIDDNDDINLYKNFINKWCPSSLRKEIEYNPIFLDKKLYSIKRYIKNGITKDQGEALKKGSRAKSFDSWCEFVIDILNSEKYNIEDVLSSDIKVIKNSNDEIIYIPNTYDAYRTAGFPHWCLIDRETWNKYEKLNSIWLILLDKNDKKNSVIAEINPKNSRIEYTSYTGNAIKKENYKEFIEIAENYKKEL